MGNHGGGRNGEKLPREALAWMMLKGSPMWTMPNTGKTLFFVWD